MARADLNDWHDVARRLPRAGVYGVATTGIYCRFGCAAPRPKLENLHVFDAAAQAEAAGFRACKRCNPQTG